MSQLKTNVCVWLSVHTNYFLFYPIFRTINTIITSLMITSLVQKSKGMFHFLCLHSQKDLKSRNRNVIMLYATIIQLRHTSPVRCIWVKRSTKSHVTFTLALSLCLIPLLECWLLYVKIWRNRNPHSWMKWCGHFTPILGMYLHCLTTDERHLRPFIVFKFEGISCWDTFLICFIPTKVVYLNLLRILRVHYPKYRRQVVSMKWVGSTLHWC